MSITTIKDHATGIGVDGSYQADVNHTNDMGFQETYRCWKSTNPGIFPSAGQIDVL